MNERIKEMIKKADSKCSETRGVYDEILVSLVVNECARIAREYTLAKWDLDNSYSGTVLVERRIKEHFGVDNIAAAESLHSDKGYSLGTPEAQEAFDSKRGYKL